MSMLDEYKQIQQKKSTGSSQQSSSGSQRKSMLQEYVDKKGTEGLNKKYVETALKNGGGFGAIPGGIYQNEDGTRYIKPYTKEKTWDEVWREKYQNRSRDELLKTLDTLEENSDERKWLEEYSWSDDVMTVEDYKKLIYGKETELEDFLANEDYDATDTNSRKAYDKQIADYEAELERLKAGQWRVENKEKYGSLADNSDFKKQSQVTEDGRTAVFGLNIGDKWIGFGDPVYDYINNLDNDQMAYQISNDGSDMQGLYKYSFMTDTERSTYNYLYNTDGKKAAKEYLNYLGYELDARRMQQISADNAEYAEEHPFLASAQSIGTNLVSGIGYLDVAGQNAIKGIKEAVTGEYAGPINYNSAAMTPNVTTTSIRGTVAANLAENSTIELDEEEHPVLSRLLNGKSWGDVYQLGMSMADSTAVALLSPLVGSAGTVLLGGSAATQGMLDAVANGATDGQALTLGFVNGAAEWAFEKIGVDNLVNKIMKGDKAGIVRALISQGLAEGGEELGTSVVNTFADHLIMAEKSGYSRLIAQYEEQGYSPEEAATKALQDIAISMGWDFIGGLVTGGIMGSSGHAISSGLQSIGENAEAKRLYSSQASEIANRTLELSPDNESVQKMQAKLDKGKTLSGRKLLELVNTHDTAAIASAAEARLQELGETGEVKALSNVLAKQAVGEKLNRAEQKAIAKSKYGTRVSNELKPENIRAGQHTSEWAENIGTKRINALEYGGIAKLKEQARAVDEYNKNHTPIEPRKVEQTVPAEVKPTGNETVDSVINKAYNKELSGNDVRPVLESPEAVKALETVVGSLDLKGKSSSEQRSIVREAITSYAAEHPATAVASTSVGSKAVPSSVETVASKYGKQAGAVRSIYNISPVENVDSFATAFETAYTIGLEGGYESAAVTAESTQVMSEAQRRLAYATGKAVRAARQLEDIKRGKTGGGVVRARGMKAADINKRFKSGSNQKTALQVLRTIAEATGFTIEVFDSSGDYSMEQGSFDWGTDVIRIDIASGICKAEDVEQLAKYAMLRTFCHEFTHVGEKWAAEEYNILRTAVLEALSAHEEFDLEHRIAEIQRYDYEAKKAQYMAEGMDETAAAEKAEKEKLSWDMASREVVAEAMTDVLPESNFIRSLYEKSPSLANRLQEALRRFLARVKNYYSELVSNPSREAQALKVEIGGTVKYLEGIVEKWDAMALAAVENYQKAAEDRTDASESLTPGEEGVVANENGEPVAHSTADGTIQLSMRTYEEDGRDAFRGYLEKCVSSNRLTKAEMQEMLDGIEEIYNVCKEFKDKYAPFGTWSEAAVVRDTYGKPVFSVVTPNGEYKMNLDFSLVCKKRRTLDAVFNEMSRRGIIDDFELGQKSVVKINELIRKYGFETACALCFVDAKRFRQASMADQFVSLYNELVESLVPENQIDSINKFNFAGYSNKKPVADSIDTWDDARLDFSHLDHVMATYGKGTVEYKSAKYIKNNPEGRKLLLRGDFMSSAGFDAVKSQNPQIMKLYNSKKGTGGPKAAFGDVQYMNEIIKKSKGWTPAKAYAVGGVRVQSFSDYVPRMVFDYVQMIYDLAATKLPAHAYTKEALFVKQFGLTGIKINMSLIPAIAEGGIAPGLDANGNYVWAGESFDFETAKEIQQAEGYTENCGTICVGVSKEHIIKLLGDPDIRMVIPYHKSGLNPIVAHMNKIAEFTDYTSLATNPGGCQSTVDKNGSKVAKDFNFNAALKNTGDPKAVVRQYLDWCSKNEYTPRFAEFAWHENYYKLIEDFTLYDKDGNYVPQREVRAVFPKADSAFGSMKDLIQSGLEEDAVIEGKRNSELSAIVDEIQRTIPKTEAEIAEEQVEQADRDVEAEALARKKPTKQFEIRYPQYTREDILGNSIKLQRMAPVTTITGKEIDSVDGTLDERILSLFKQWGNNIFSEEFGDVALTKSSMRSERRHGNTDQKVRAYPALPFVVQKGVVIDAFQKNENGLERIVVAAPIIVGNQKYFMGVMLQRDASNQRLYAHDVVIEKEPTNTSEDILSTTGSPKSGELYISDILLRALNVNPQHKAVEIFGTTTDFNEAGFILPSGEMLRFTDDKHKGERQYDHRAIGMAYGVDVDLSVNHGFNEDSAGHLENFIEDGGIRFDPGDPDLDMDAGMQLSSSVPLTKEQERAIRDFVEWKQQREEAIAVDEDSMSLYSGPLALHIEFGGKAGIAVGQSSKNLDAWGVKHLSYEGGQINASRIISDIRHYYETGEVRQPSETARFRYQRRTPSYTDREVLEIAAEDMSRLKLTDGERSALDIFGRRLDNLKSLEQQRDEQRRILAELNSAAKPNVDEIRKTKNRLGVLGRKIKNAEAQVLSVEDKQVLKKVLHTARRVVETEQRNVSRENRNTTAMRHKVRDIVNELNNYLLKGTKDKHVMIGLQKAVASALDVVNMDTIGAEERIAKLEAELMKAKTPEKIQEISRKIDNVRAQGDKMSEKLANLKAAYAEIKDSSDPLIANSHDDVIEAAIENVAKSVGETPLRNMTLEQLQDVYDLYKMILTTIRNSNKSFKADKQQSIDTLASSVQEEVETVGGKKKHLKLFEGVSGFLWNNFKPVYAFKAIGSKTLSRLFNTVRAGEDTWAKDVSEAKAFYLEQSKKYGYDAWDFKKTHAFKSTTGMDFKLTLEQMMSLYAYSKRQQAEDHLKYGGIVFEDSFETKKLFKKFDINLKTEDATAYNISPETMAAIAGMLTADQKAFVDAMQDYLSTTMGEKGNEVSLEMYGVKLFKEKHYFPLKSAPQYMAKAREQAKGEVKIKNSGFTKETNPHAKNPIVLESFMDVWANHVNDMSMYHAFTLPLEDFYRVYNYRTPSANENMPTEGVNPAIQNAYGKGATNYIEQLVKDLNGGARSDPTAGIINKMIGLFKKGAVFASASVVVQQPSAIARAMALVDSKYFIGRKMDSHKHKALWEEVKQYAPVAMIKEMGYFDTNMGMSTVDFIKAKEYNSWDEKMKALVTDSDYRDEALSKLPALADELAWTQIWEAVKRETSDKHPALKTDSAEFLELAGARFTEVIVNTQVYDSVLSRSANMRSKDTGMKMATAFLAEPTTSINMIADALIQGKRGDKKQAGKAVGAVIASQILNAILVSFVYAARDDDEDETYWEKYIASVVAEAKDSFNPAGYIPFLKDIVSIVQGYDVERSDISVIADIWKAYEQLDSDKISGWRKVENFAGGIAQLFGLPVRNVMRDTRALYQTVESAINGEQITAAGLRYAIKGAITNETVTDRQQLYEAMLDGDTAHSTRVAGRFEDQAAVDSAIRKALRENDSRIHEAAVARYEGDIAEYTRIAKEIIAEGHFKQDHVVLAITAEMNSLDTEKSESEIKAGPFYTDDDYYKAIVAGDRKAAAEVKAGLIKQDVAKGELESKAEKSVENSFVTNVKNAFLDGEVSESKVKSYLTTFGGKDEDEANTKLAEWKFERKYGYSWSNYDNAYRLGDISKEQLVEAMMEVKGMDEFKATYEVEYLDFQINHPEYELEKSKYLSYHSTIDDVGVSLAGAGIDLAMWLDYEAATEGLRKVQKLLIIDSLPLTADQKDAIYFKEGWARSTLGSAAWR